MSTSASSDAASLVSASPAPVGFARGVLPFFRDDLGFAGEPARLDFWPFFAPFRLDVLPGEEVAAGLLSAAGMACPNVPTPRKTPSLSDEFSSECSSEFLS